MGPQAVFLLTISITYGISSLYSHNNDDGGDLELTILHTNDVHSRFLSFNQNVQPCTEKNRLHNKCWGGAARLATAVKKFRQLYKNAILLDAGDQFQGSIWFTTLKWAPIAAYMNKLNYTAMAIGNHEFDDGDQLLADFASNVNFPMINSNIDASESKSLNGTFVPYILKTIGEKTIGFLGTTASETTEISRPSRQVKFMDEIDSLNSLIQKLKKEHEVDKFIILSHSGIQRDVEMCNQTYILITPSKLKVRHFKSYSWMNFTQIYQMIPILLINKFP
uniref:5'-nucleotidase n=1 Tax=Romanomermis culicivorax TaxID=13658 RepID=A0A915IFF6_ROMCU